MQAMADEIYTVERSATIAAPADAIYPQIVDFHRWPAWSPWEDIDPAMERTYSGPESGVGATYAWSGNRQAGRGRMQITAADPATGVTIHLVFEKPFRADNTIEFSLRPDADATRVVWTMSGRKTFLLRVTGLFTSMDRLIGPDFEKGLSRLRTVTEAPAG